MVIVTSVTFVRGLAGLLLLHLHHGLGGHGGQLVPRHVVDRALHAAAGHAVALVHQDHCSTQQLQGALQSIGGLLTEIRLRQGNCEESCHEAANPQTTAHCCKTTVFCSVVYFISKCLVEFPFKEKSAWSLTGSQRIINF